MTPKVVIVGMPGAGKSTTGRRLAKILAVPFADSDDLVEEREGRSVGELFAERGEDAYRALEAEVVATALADFPGVLSLGGGALTRGGTRERLVAGAVPVVYLRAGVDELSRRVGDGRTRPLLVDDPSARLAVLADERASGYEQVATIIVDTDRRTPGQVAAAVAARLHDHERQAGR